MLNGRILPLAHAAPPRMTIWSPIAEAIAAAEAAPFSVDSYTGVGGGCINEAFVLSGNGRRYFVKLHEPRLEEMFAAEAEGLSAILAAQAIRAPRPVCWGNTGAHSYLVLEFIRLHGAVDAARFGERLAQMHRHTQARFGWYRDNTIGSTPQPNAELDDWVAFWGERRLGFQLELAARRGAGRALIDKGERLMERLDGLFTDYRPVPSLLHGDLWSGNWGSDDAGEPVIFDPAVYFGDREADLAMTELFGGPGAEFYAAYEAAWPLDPGYRVRKQLYNLYHVLNHYNLFGGGYAGQAERMAERLLAELR